MPIEPIHELETSATAADSIQAQLLLDRCHDLIGENDYRSAAAAAQQSIDLVPNQPDPYIAMAEAMVGMSAHERAVEAYDEAYERTKPALRYEILKGRAYNKHCSENYIGAIDDLTEMIALQPGNKECYTRRGITRGEIGDYQGAIDDFDRAAAVSGLDADLHNLLAYAHMQEAFRFISDKPDKAQEMAKQALVHFDSALDVEPLHEQAAKGVQTLRSHMGRFGIEM